MESLSQWLPLLGIAMMRPLGVMLFLPVFNNVILGGSLVRNALALVLCFPVFPLLLASPFPAPADDLAAYIGVLARELLVGVFLGFSAAIPFWALDMSGFLVDTVRGSSMASVLNPLLGTQSSLFGSFFNQLAAVLFFISGGFSFCLTELYRSYSSLPPGEHWVWQQGFISLLKHEWNILCTLALTFCMPALVVMVLLDLALGLINKSAQQINVFSLSMPIKSILVCLILVVSLQFGLQTFTEYFAAFSGGLLTVLGPAS